MIGKIQMLAIISVLVLGGAAATVELPNDTFERKFRPEGHYKVEVVEVDALFDHEIHLLIGSGDDKPLWGTVEIMPIFRPQFERDEWDCDTEFPEEKDEHKERPHEEEGEEERPCEEEEKEERPHDEEEEEEDEEYEKDDCEEDHHEDEDPDDECCREKEEREEREESDEHHERDYKEEKSKRGEHKERFKGSMKKFKFEFKEGKGDLLLFPSSHDALDLVAHVTIFGVKEPIIEPYIHVIETKTDIYIDDSDDEGKRFCRIRKGRGIIGYGFEDMKDQDWNDWDYNDVVLTIGKIHKQKPQKSDVKVYVLKAKWGQLEGLNEEHKDMVEWDGFISVRGGKIKPIKPLLFEFDGEYEYGCDDELFPARERTNVEWRSSTTVHWDGIAVKIIVPLERDEPTHVGFSTPQWSERFTEEDLTDLYIRETINDLGDEIEITCHELRFDHDVESTSI